MSEQHEIIDHIPSQQELAQMYRPDQRTTYEPIDQHISNGYKFGNEEDIGPEAILLKNLNSELQWGDPAHKDRLVANAYGVARHFGDQAIALESIDALTLIDDTRKVVRKGMEFKGTTVDEGDGQTGGYVRTHHAGWGGRKEFAVEISQAYGSGATRKAVEAELSKEGVVIKPEDLSLMVFLHVTGHEAGHAIQVSLAEPLLDLIDSAEGSEIDAVSRTSAYALMQNPDKSITGNLETDAFIHNERFAEGYARLVTTEVARTLGYDQKATDAFLKAMSFGEDNMSARHLLAQVTADKSLQQVLKDEGSTVYAGELGYTKPLSKAELIGEIDAISAVFRNWRFNEQNPKLTLSQGAYSTVAKGNTWVEGALSELGQSSNSKEIQRDQRTKKLSRILAQVGFRGRK